MGTLRAELLPSLRGIPPATLAEVCADGYVHASPAWFRFLAAVDLRAATGAGAALAFAAAFDGAELVGLLPLTRVRGDHADRRCSLQGTFFDGWLADEAAANPAGAATTFRRAATLRRALELAGARLRDAWLAGGIDGAWAVPAIAPSAVPPRREILAALLRAACGQAAANGVPLWLVAAPADLPLWSGAGRRAGMEPVFLGHEWRVDLAACRGHRDFLNRLPPAARRRAAAEAALLAAAGMEWTTGPLSEVPPGTLAELQARTPARGGLRRLRPEPHWRALAEAFGGAARTAVVRQMGVPAGFATLLVSMRRGEATLYGGGWDDGPTPPPAPLATACGVDAPLRMACALGLRQLWLGAEAPPAAFARGAAPVDLESWLWFPRRRERWALAPYLRRFGQHARRRAEARLRPAALSATPARPPRGKPC